MINNLQKDALKEIINIGVGRAAMSLNQMLDTKIELSVPKLFIMSSKNICDEIGDLCLIDLASVSLDFDGSFQGKAALVFPPESAAKLVSTLTGEALDSPDLDAMMAGTLNEVGNILINGIMGSFSNLLSEELLFNLPTYAEGNLFKILHRDLEREKNIILINTFFQIKNLSIEGSVFLIFEIASLEALIRILNKLLADSCQG